MSLSLIGACLWLVLANMMAMVPSRDHHWRRAYVLIAIGLPLLIWVFASNALWVSGLVLLAMMSVLRWPVRYLARWVQRQMGGAGG